MEWNEMNGIMFERSEYGVEWNEWIECLNEVSMINYIGTHCTCSIEYYDSQMEHCNCT